MLLETCVASVISLSPPYYEPVKQDKWIDMTRTQIVVIHDEYGPYTRAVAGEVPIDEFEVVFDGHCGGWHFEHAASLRIHFLQKFPLTKEQQIGNTK